MFEGIALDYTLIGLRLSPRIGGLALILYLLIFIVFLFKKRNFLTPKPDPDPLAKNTGFGWGWFVAMSVIGYSIDKALARHSPEIHVALNVIYLPIIAIIYFRIRKKIIEKRRLGNSISTASFLAGMYTFLLMIPIYIVTIFFLRVIGKT